MARSPHGSDRARANSDDSARARADSHVAHVSSTPGRAVLAGQGPGPAQSRPQPRLCPISEPHQLRETLLALARERPRELIRRLGEGEWIVDLLVEEWGESLRRAGVARPLLARIVGDYRLELWLWVVGERRWEQVLDGLAGRLSRRIG